MPRAAPKPLDASKLMDYAVRTLSGRAQSLGELRQKLQRRAADKTDVDATLSKLKELGYLNDQQFAEAFAASRLRNDLHGRLRVLRDLRQRRVAPKLAEQAVEQTFKDTDEPALIQTWLARKYRNQALPAYLSDPHHLAQVFRRLRYAGFSASAAIRTLRQYSSQAEELEDSPDLNPDVTFE